MGIFDLFDDVVDFAIKLPGEVVEKTLKTVVRLPEIPIDIVQSGIKGVEDGVKSVEKLID